VSEAVPIVEQKSGRRLKRIGCALLILAIPPLTIYLLALLHATNAGAWAAQTVVPAFPNSRLLSHEPFTHVVYDGQIDIYAASAPITDIRNWFDRYIELYPDDSDDAGHYYSAFNPLRFSNEYLFYFMAGNVTLRIPGKTYTYDIMPDCFQVEIMRPDVVNESSFQPYFQNIEGIDPVNDTLIVLQTCWPNWGTS
jgi:hypothetical protein